MRILLIHGRSQGGKKPAKLEASWLDTLREGYRAANLPWPAALSVDFPYYGDELDRLVAQAALPAPEDVIRKGPGQNLQYEAFVQSALDEMRVNAAISDAEISAQLEPGAPQQKGVQNWRWVQAIARTIDRRWTSAATFTIDRFLRDVYLYVTKENVQRQIDRIVEDKITGEPTVVVAHSLGTVVAYKVILKNRARLDLRKIVTVGSPLGLKAISSKLGVPENPAGAAGWYNAFDRRDIVALNPLDATCFPTRPEITNNNGVKNDTDNRHGIVGYLNDPQVAGEIAAALRS
jgi:hypothetical protein